MCLLPPSDIAIYRATKDIFSKKKYNFLQSSTGHPWSKNTPTHINMNIQKTFQFISTLFFAALVEDGK